MIAGQANHNGSDLFGFAFALGGLLEASRRYIYM